LSIDAYLLEEQTAKFLQSDLKRWSLMGFDDVTPTTTTSRWLFIWDQLYCQKSCFCCSLMFATVAQNWKIGLLSKSLWKILLQKFTYFLQAGIWGTHHSLVSPERVHMCVTYCCCWCYQVQNLRNGIS